METQQDFVTVSIRIKPPPQQCPGQACLEIISKNPPVLMISDRLQTYHFDNVFTASDNGSQEEIYNGTVKHLIEHVKEGYSCTVFAYGQTGTGKSFTIGTDIQVNQENLGLIPRSLNDFFEYNPDDKTEVEISLSYIEIYNTKVFDLLSNDKVPLQVKGFKAEGCRQEKVFNLRDAKHFLDMGNKNRHTAGTNQNAKSSRSHAIFTVYCKVKDGDKNTIGKLNLVDLAGCESVKKTGSQGSTFHEGVHINKGLLAIGQVMKALANKSVHIPYRGSLVTSILQDSLNTKNFISLIACVSSQSEDSTETMRTLEFSQGVKKMRNKPEVNEAISQFKKEYPILFGIQRTSMTPFKKPATPTQTPFRLKKSKSLKPLPLINERSVSASASENSADSRSFGLSAVSSIMNGEMSQQALSPVIRKYISALESSLMDKLETVIKSTLKRSDQSSRFDKKHMKENIDCTPSLGWSNLEQHVAHLVRTEVAQLTGKTNARATSSPLDLNLSRVCKVLNYDSPADMVKSIMSSDSLENTKSNANASEEQFKIPQLHTLRTKNLTLYKRTPPLSPIQTPLIAPRRSVRLSMKRMEDKTFNQTNSFIDRSNDNLGDQTKTEITIKKAKEVREKLFDTTSRLPSKRKKKNLPVKELEVEDSIMMKKRKISVAFTPAIKKLRQNDKKESPHTAHIKEVVSILNEGTVNQLKKLPTIGEKSALQIIAFRKLKGSIEAVSDLSKMPGWSRGKCDRFEEYYFLKKIE